jgi:RecJ-like exonuclease
MSTNSQQPCPDCRGAGTYIGLAVVEACRACEGRGYQLPESVRGISPLAEFLPYRQVDEGTRRFNIPLHIIDAGDQSGAGRSR